MLDHPTMTTLTLHLEAPTPGGLEATRVRVVIGTSKQPPTTHCIIDLEGSMTDFLGTLVEEVTLAWAYGERPKDVAKTAEVVRKQARAHAAQYDF